MAIKRVFLIVLDSFGIGAAPDAANFGDEGSNTLASVSSSEFFSLPVLTDCGLFNIDGISCREGVSAPSAAFARMRELSVGKDTTTGHWEISGLISDKPLPTYPEGFPQDVVSELEAAFGRKILCNRPYSGTKVIHDYGREHLETGALIVYTSADSVLQIAAHEKLVPVEELYSYCRTARKIMAGRHAVGRIIARPFEGEWPDYVRTPRRHDFSLEPPGKTILDLLSSSGHDVIAVGKINDIFAGRGVTEYVPASSNDEGMEKILKLLRKDFNGLCFVNLVDFDMLFGHRNDIDGYASALTRFDSWLKGALPLLGSGDVLMITADHGCDPGFLKTTDHTREYTPLLILGEKVRPGSLGTRSGFCDIGATVCFLLDTDLPMNGTPISEAFKLQ